MSVMPFVLVLDRSMPVVPDPIRGPGVMAVHPLGEWRCEHRGRIALALQSAGSVAALITYSDVARAGLEEDSGDPLWDFVYGSNLSHALRLAREACRSSGSGHVILVTYSLPSAHHDDGGPQFFIPPIPESLDAARREAATLAEDGLGLDVFVLTSDDVAENQALVAFFQALVEPTQGEVISVAPAR